MDALSSPNWMNSTLVVSLQDERSYAVDSYQSNSAPEAENLIAHIF
jgi:hypothetical protein